MGLAEKLKPNVLALALIAACMIVGLVASLPSMLLEKPEVVTLIFTVTSAFIGGLVVVLNKLVDPPPDPAVPASIVREILELKEQQRSMDV